MRYSFRLAELLGHTPDRRRRPGTIKAIVEETGLDRHQVASLLKNEAKYVPLEALSRICDYLIDHGYATADQLPGALFSIKPENFWELLARRRKLEICVGVRRGEADAPESAWVVASDAVLMGALLNGVSTLGGIKKLSTRLPGQADKPETTDSPHPEKLQQTLVWSPGQVSFDLAQQRATQVFNEYSEAKGDKALVCVGSMKSNPVVELALAEAFECNPFESQDDLPEARQRSIPFYLRYRDSDPHPPAAAAGFRLSKSEPAEKPGFYYEKENGKWVYAGGGEGEDAALVFYIYREPLGRLDMIFSGFSGRATRLMARTLASRAEEFWPPVYEEPSMQIGAFIVHYESDNNSRGDDLLQTNLTVNPRITRIPPSVIKRRLEQL